MTWILFIFLCVLILSWFREYDEWNWGKCRLCNSLFKRCFLDEHEAPRCYRCPECDRHVGPYWFATDLIFWKAPKK